MSCFPYSFEAPIDRLDFGRHAYVVVFLPGTIAAQPPFNEQARVRVAGEVADRPFEGAWQTAGGGRRYLLLSQRFLKESELKVRGSPNFG